MRKPPDELRLTPAAARELDRLAVERYGMSLLVLMENAAAGAARVARGMLGDRPGRVLLVAGPGNNGGDALAMARHLANAGHEVRLALAGLPATPEARANHRIAERMGLAMAPAGAQAPDGPWSLVVDGLLGTGLSRPLSGEMAAVVGVVNALGRAGTPVLALDVPSGMDAQTGEAWGVAVRADATATFAAAKPGLRTPAGAALAGRVEVVDIGVPRALLWELAAAPGAGRSVSGPGGIDSPRADAQD